MEVSGDELAGVVELFGALTREEMASALGELAFKAGTEPPEDEVIAAAVDRYVLVTVDREGEELLTVGPAAFPALPPGAEDLPHILDVDPREVDRAALAPVVEERFRIEAARAVADGDEDAIDRLLDLTYDLEAWGPLELATVRERLTAEQTT